MVSLAVPVFSLKNFDTGLYTKTVKTEFNEALSKLKGIITGTIIDLTVSIGTFINLVVKIKLSGIIIRVIAIELTISAKIAPLKLWIFL